MRRIDFHPFPKKLKAESWSFLRELEQATAYIDRIVEEIMMRYFELNRNKLLSICIYSSVSEFKGIRVLQS